MTDQSEPETTTLGHEEVLAAGLADWRLLNRQLHAKFRTGGFTTGLALVDRIGAAAEAADHHPDLTLTWPMVAVRLSSHDAGGVTQRDVDLARTISGLAADAGVDADPQAVSMLDIGLDAADWEKVSPFWAALLGYDADGDDLVDPDGLLSTLWWQQTDEHPTPRQRWHFDIWLPHDVVRARIDASLAAGGTLVSDEWAPRFWVLADADGNRACICTAEERGEFGGSAGPDLG